jgi:hypothetical protein
MPELSETGHKRQLFLLAGLLQTELGMLLSCNSLGWGCVGWERAMSLYFLPFKLCHATMEGLTTTAERTQSPTQIKG